MASFSELYASFDADPAKRGWQFERFVKWFLATDPKWSKQVDKGKIWLWEDYPEPWGRDCGVDLVFQHRDGKTWAVQAKCYRPDYEIKKSDIDKFLSETSRSQIDRRLLIATTEEAIKRIAPTSRPSPQGNGGNGLDKKGGPQEARLVATRARELSEYYVHCRDRSSITQTCRFLAL